jgi:uncharacterized integral membrane protein
MLLATIFLSLALLVWVSLAIPNRSVVQLGFRQRGGAENVVPAARLMLLPVLNAVSALTSILLGLFFFRNENSRPIAYLLWSSSVVVGVLFLAAVYFILRAS